MQNMRRNRIFEKAFLFAPLKNRGGLCLAKPKAAIF